MKLELLKHYGVIELFMSGFNLETMAVDDPTSFNQNVVILSPIKHEDDRYSYPEHTADLKKVLQREMPGVEVTLLDESLPLEIQHSADVIMPVIDIGIQLISNIGVSIVANIIVSFILSKVKATDKDTTNVKLKVKIHDGKESKELSYDGPASEVSKLAEIMERMK